MIDARQAGLRSLSRPLGGFAALALSALVAAAGCGSSSKKPSDGGAGHDGGSAGHDGGAAGADAGEAGSDGAAGDALDAPADGVDGAGGSDAAGDTTDAPASDASDAAVSEGGSDAGATDGGSDVSDGGDASACEAGTSACAVAGSLSGLLWKLPCTAYESGPACATTSATTQSTQLAGTAGVTYDVTLRFRGIVEQKTYTGGCGDGTTAWLQSGADNGDSFNVYKLAISSPPQTYFLNAGASNITHLFGIDFQQTVRIDAGATVTLFADAKDGQEIINVGADGTTPVTVAGVSVTQPYNGQFVQMDVVNVAADPVASSATIGGGSPGGALAFDNSKGQMLTVPDATSLQPSSLTFESWFTFAGTTGAYAALGCKTYGNGSGDSICLWFESGALHGGVNASSPSGMTVAPWTPVANEWHHAALVFDTAASKTTMYLDGIAASCVPQTPPVTYDNHPFLIGADIEYGSPNGFWNGAVDETRLFSTARTPAQIWADMHTHALGPTTGLVAEWTFDEGTGQTTADKSGTGNAATLGATSAVETSDPTWISSTVPH